MINKLATAVSKFGEIGKEGTKSNELQETKEYSTECGKKKILTPDIDKVKTSSLESILQENREKILENHENVPDENINLTAKDKEVIKKETDWSNNIVDNIRSKAEYEIYRKADLYKAEINGNDALIRQDIDWDQKDEKGKTNTERIERGLAPLDKDGSAIELHHIGQHEDSPLAELTFKEHRCEGNDTILHDKTKETETHGEGNTWNTQRQEYWKGREIYNSENF